MNFGLQDKNLSRRFGNLSEEQKNIIKADRGEINAANIGNLTPDDRKKLKDAIDQAEKDDTNTKQGEAEAKHQGEIQSVKDKGIENDELEGANRLIFIGTGSGGSGSDFNKNLTKMKNSTYYAATYEPNIDPNTGKPIASPVIKEISSITNNVEPILETEEKIVPLFVLTQQSMVKVAAAKNAEKRDRLTKVLSKELGALLPDGLNNLKFANKLKQSLQIVFGYDIGADGKMKGKGRVQFVPQIGDPVSSAIIIENNEYVFDNKALQDMKEAGKTAEKVISQLTGQNVTEGTSNNDQNKEDPIPESTKSDDNKKHTEYNAVDGTRREVDGPDSDDENFFSDVESTKLGGKKRKTYRKKKASKAKRIKVAKKTRKARKKMKRAKR